MTPKELLITGAAELGVPLSVEQVNTLFLYLAELKKWNRKINLTAIRDDRDTIIKHVLDSLSYIRGFSPASGLRLLDMGSGAGFPAIPIKIVHPEIAVTLVESVKKKASFLRHIVRTFSLNSTEVMDLRTDELGDPYLASYDLVTARAFADMEKALEAGVPFLKPDGLLVLSRGPEEKIEEQRLKQTGVSLVNKIELTLPHSDYGRVIWIFRKTA